MENKTKFFYGVYFILCLVCQFVLAGMNIRAGLFWISGLILILLNFTGAQHFFPALNPDRHISSFQRVDYQDVPKRKNLNRSLKRSLLLALPLGINLILSLCI